VNQLTKVLVGAGLVAIVLLCIATFIPYPPAAEIARAAGFSDSTIETGLQLNFERRIFFWIYTVIELGLICVLALTPIGRRVADRLLVWTRGYRIPAALGMGCIYLVLHDLLTLPVGIARFYHSHAWGLANPSYDLAAWLRDHYLAFAVNIPWEVAVVVALYAGLIITPRIWWLLAPIGMTILGVAYVFLAPILINPLFNDFTPLRKTQWADQQPRVQAIIDEAKIPVAEILVMDASRQSTHTNAYFTGFGSTRRIVLYDTLLKNHTPEEIESVLAHEIGHWQHDHIVKGMLIAIVGSVFGFLILHLFLRGAVGQAPWNLASVADPAGLWLILLLLGAGSWLAMPAESMISRHFERQADEVSLDLGKQPQAFIDSERKMAIDNKSNVAPTPWNVWLFASHPPTVERIRMAEDWEKAHKP
jgi:STE24 endopeptidase